MIKLNFSFSREGRKLHACGLHYNEVLCLEQEGKYWRQRALCLRTMNLGRRMWLGSPDFKGQLDRGQPTGPTPEFPYRKVSSGGLTYKGALQLQARVRGSRTVESVVVATPEEAMDWHAHQYQDVVTTLLYCKSHEHVVQELKKKGFDVSQLTKYHSGGYDLKFSIEHLLEERRLSEELARINARSSPQGDMS